MCNIQLYFYSLQQKLQKGNVFTNVCQEFCPWGFCLGRHPPEQTPPRQTPPWVDIALGRQPPPSPEADIPPMQTLPPGQTPPLGRHPPRQPLQRTVCILLECILVEESFHRSRSIIQIMQTRSKYNKNIVYLPRNTTFPLANRTFGISISFYFIKIVATNKVHLRKISILPMSLRLFSQVTQAWDGKVSRPFLDLSI